MSTTLGLISDTHLPDRCRALPEAVFDALAGVDLILHAGDVGELSVLDELSRIAPVIAIHGNDELAGAPDVLPGRQVIALAGRRILLNHGHHPDRAEEMADRQVDDWHPKLARWAGLARAAGASVFVYGHTHVGWAIEHDGVWLVNPGAIAGGNHMLRQARQTVARMTLNGGQPPDITYLDLADLDRPIAPAVDPDAGFLAAFARVAESIVSPALEAERGWLMEHVFWPAPDPVRDALRRLMYRCLDGDLAQIDLPDLAAELLAAPDVPAEVKNRVRARWSAA